MSPIIEYTNHPNFFWIKADFSIDPHDDDMNICTMCNPWGPHDWNVWRAFRDDELILFRTHWDPTDEFWNINVPYI